MNCRGAECRQGRLACSNTACESREYSPHEELLDAANTLADRFFLVVTALAVVVILTVIGRNIF